MNELAIGIIYFGMMKEKTKFCNTNVLFRAHKSSQWAYQMQQFIIQLDFMI